MTPAKSGSAHENTPAAGQAKAERGQRPQHVAECELGAAADFHPADKAPVIEPQKHSREEMPAGQMNDPVAPPVPAPQRLREGPDQSGEHYLTGDDVREQ